jgi:preprotein translocase subunit SecD
MRKLRSLTLVSITIVSLTLTSCLSSLRGQDLKGGSQLIVELQETPSVPKINERELDAVIQVVEGRIKGLGISEAVVQKTKVKNQILVQLPGIKDPTQAIRVLGSTAQLEFKKQKLNDNTQLFTLQASRNELKVKLKEAQTSKDAAAIAKNQKALQNNSKAIAQLFESTNPPLTGRYLKDAYGEPTQGNGWEIAIRFNQQGGDLFTALTKETAGTGRAIGIFLDNELISSPIVGKEYATTGITGGTAVITGRFNATDANDLSVQLRGGALPVPVKVKVVNSGS